MPQSYQQPRNTYLQTNLTRPISGNAKRGGRRPKEFEEYVCFFLLILFIFLIVCLVYKFRNLGSRNTKRGRTRQT